MITIKHESTTYTVQDNKAAMYRDLIDSGKAYRVKKIPEGKRNFPTFTPGMTTGDYVKYYAQMNDVPKLMAVVYVHADRAAPMLDPTQPEVSEEADPDYTYTPTTKPKAKTASQLKTACREALDLLARGDVCMAQCILSEVSA